MAIKPKYSLYDANPALSSEWHPTKNGELTPSDVSPSSVRKVWWLCKNGHDYESTITNRSSKKRGCPYCSGRYATSENNLLNSQPHCVSQWHPTKNGAESPLNVLPQSKKRVWWKCEHGHEWVQPICDRVKDKRVCPICLSLAEKHTDIALQWHPSKNGALTPLDVTYGSDKKVWWQCAYGHEWLASISHRTINKSGCPHCVVKSSDIEIRIYTELKCLFNNVHWRSKVAKNEVDVFLSEEKLAIEIDGHYWHKNRGEKDLAKAVLFKGMGIKLLRLREVPLKLLGEYDINFSNSQHHKDVINKLVISITSCCGITVDGNIKDYLASSDYLNDKEFRILSSSLPKPEWDKSLETLYPSLAAHWNYEQNFPLLPSMHSPYSNKKVWWKCENGHEWRTSINHRSSKNIGCPYCSGRYSTKEDNLKSKFPELASEWHPEKNGPLAPQDFRGQSNAKVWWQCKKGHEWQAVISSRHESGCPYCSGKKPTSENSFLALYPELASEWDFAKNGLRTPEQFVSGSSVRVWWKCKNGHEWESVIRNRVRNPKCPKCKVNGL